MVALQVEACGHTDKLCRNALINSGGKEYHCGISSEVCS